MIKTVSVLRGDYSFVAVFPDGTLSAARFHEPLILGVGKSGYFISSDVLGFVQYTDEAIYPNNGEIIIINANGLQFLDFLGRPVKHEITKISREFADVYKNNNIYFTINKISKQKNTILKTANNTRSELELFIELVKNAKSLHITGSGTSYNAALIAKHIFLKYAKIKIESVIASEARFYTNYFENHSILIALSKSGESADVLEAVKMAKRHNSTVISIVNTMTSSLPQISSVSVGLNCGPEIGVAATKSFTSQLGILYKIADNIAVGHIGFDSQKISQSMKEILVDHSKIRDIAKILSYASDIYIIGRGIHYPIALEASLKLKELTYIHAEGLPGGEVKHGPLALMDTSVYVIIINPHDSTNQENLASAHEIKVRGAKIIGISDKYDDTYDYWIKIPTITEPLFPFIEIVPIQLLAYYAAVEKHTDPDYPRNLAKSVTVK